MTPQKFLLHYFEIINENSFDHDALIAECLYDDINDCDLDNLFSIMNEYARIMCEKQKEICADAARLTWEYEGDGSYDGRYIVDIDSILNSPLPKELENEN